MYIWERQTLPTLTYFEQKGRFSSVTRLPMDPFLQQSHLWNKPHNQIKYQKYHQGEETMSKEYFCYNMTQPNVSKILLK